MWWLGAIVFVAAGVLFGSTFVNEFEPTEKGRAQLRLVQALGFNCSTPVGVCPIPPSPVGAQCFCGSVPGTVVQ